MSKASEFVVGANPALSFSLIVFTLLELYHG
jgi:hypothetical protein